MAEQENWPVDPGPGRTPPAPPVNTNNNQALIIVAVAALTVTGMFCGGILLAGFLYYAAVPQTTEIVVPVPVQSYGEVDSAEGEISSGTTYSEF